MLRNILCIAMRKKIENLIYEFDNLLRGYQILRENVHEKEVPVLGHASCSVSDFHSLMLSFQTLLENTCEKDFLNYVRNEDDVRSKYIEMSNEHESLKTAYQSATQNILMMDTKLKEATNERDMLISMFDELKKMLLNGTFRRLPNMTINKLSTMIESIRKPTDNCVSDGVTTNNKQTEFPTQINHSVLPYADDTLSFDTNKTEVFLPDSPRIESPELLVPDSIYLCDENASNSDSDKVNVTGDVQVITVTWDEMTDKSSDGEDYRAVRQQRKRNSKSSAFPKQWLSCKTCGRQFTKKNNLERHESLHTSAGKLRPYSCSMCSKSYMNKGDLNRHTRTHSDERFYCSVCGKGFAQNGTLRRHQKIHSNIKDFICNDCNKAYTSKWALKAHIILKMCPFAKY